jgi:hypothetical protein
LAPFWPFTFKKLRGQGTTCQVTLKSPTEAASIWVKACSLKSRWLLPALHHCTLVAAGHSSVTITVTDLPLAESVIRAQAPQMASS